MQDKGTSQSKKFSWCQSGIDILPKLIPIMAIKFSVDFGAEAKVSMGRKKMVFQKVVHEVYTQSKIKSHLIVEVDTIKIVEYNNVSYQNLKADYTGYKELIDA